MKKIIMMIILLIVLSCEGVAGVDKAPYVLQEISDVEVFENSAPVVIDIKNTFTDDEGDPIRVTLLDNNNPNLVQVEIDTIGLKVTLTFTPNQIGVAAIKIQAEANNRFVVESFLVTVSQLPDQAPTVVNAIANVSVSEGTQSTEIDLTNVFTDSDNDDSGITKVVKSNSNTGLVTATINGNTLTLSYTALQTGNANIVIEATSNGKTVTDEFTVTVTQNEALLEISSGETSYGTGNFLQAETAFLNAITNGDSRYVERAYVGLAFSRLAQGSSAKLDSAYASFHKGLDLPQNEYQEDFQAGIAFLEYSMKRNNEAAIENAILVLENNPSWQLGFNTNINHKDVRLTLASAYYDNQQFSDAFFHVKILDPEVLFTDDDPEFLTLLANKIRELADLLNE